MSRPQIVTVIACAASIVVGGCLSRTPVSESIASAPGPASPEADPVVLHVVSNQVRIMRLSRSMDGSGRVGEATLREVVIQPECTPDMEALGRRGGVVNELGTRGVLDIHVLGANGRSLYFWAATLRPHDDSAPPLQVQIHEGGGPWLRLSAEPGVYDLTIESLGYIRSTAHVRIRRAGVDTVFARLPVAPLCQD
jgi:hypothetical protein